MGTAPASNPVAATEEPEYASCEVRKVENGYVTRMSHSKGGEYKSHERYSRERPDVSKMISPEQRHGEKNTGNHLRGAIAALNMAGKKRR